MYKKIKVKISIFDKLKRENFTENTLKISKFSAKISVNFQRKFEKNLIFEKLKQFPPGK